MKRPSRRASASSRVSVLVSVRRRVSGSAKPAEASAAVSCVGIREALAVDLGDPRDEPGDPDGLEVLGVEGPDREPAAGSEHARGLGERGDELDVLDDLPHERARRTSRP